MIEPGWGVTVTGGQIAWKMQGCCKQWLDKNEAPTTCPECGTEYIVTADFEVWPAHMLMPPTVLGMEREK